MNRGPTSFDRIFARSAGEVEGEGSPPSVHELFTAVMRDELDLGRFAEALEVLHGVRLTPTAIKLLSSTDGRSGRLQFSQFQRALQDDSGDNDMGAGKASIFKDQAKAIIADNCGEAVAPDRVAVAKVHTDISKDEFVKQKVRVEMAQARGPGPGSNPVVPTNRVSLGNPLVAARVDATGSDAGKEESATRDMANTATRMFISGELNRKGYEDLLGRVGVKLTAESELQRMILSHEKVGDGRFVPLSRALQRELGAVVGA